MMENKTLVDEYDKLTRMQRDVEMKIEELKKQIVELSIKEGKEILFGTHKNCSIKGYEKVVYPEDKSIIEKMLKEKGLYDRFSSVNYFKLNPRILKGEVDKEIVNLTKKEKAFRLSLIDRGV